MIDQFGDVFPFWPVSFRLPQQFEEFYNFFSSKSSEGENLIILKPPLAARGERIRLISSPDQITKDDEYIVKNFPVAQQYV